MNTKLLSTVAVAALLVLAGCAGTSPSTTTTTEAPTTTTPQPTTTTPPTTTDPVEYVAPGVSTEGVVDGFQLGEAHADTLRLNSYTVVQTETTTFANGTLASSVETVVKHAGGATLGTKAVDGEQVAAFYHDGTSGALKTGNVTNPLAAPTDAWAVSPGTWAENVYAVVAASDMTVEQFETETGKIRQRLTAEEPTRLVVVPDDAQNAQVTVILSGIGLVNEYTITYETTVNGESATYTKTVAFTNLDSTSVQAPAWYDSE